MPNPILLKALVTVGLTVGGYLLEKGAEVLKEKIDNQSSSDKKK